MKSGQEPQTIQSVERAAKILLSFSLETPRWRVSELSQAFGWHPSTTSRLLSTLRKSGLLTKDPLTHQYELGLRILGMAHVVLGQVNLVKVALPFMTNLVERCNEAAFLVLLDGTTTVTIAQVAAPRLMAATPYHVGRRYQASAVSGGKILLAYGPHSSVERLMEEGLEAYTEYTITSPSKLLEVIEQVRKDGYAFSDQELEIGLFAVAAPIRDHEGGVIAALSVSGPPARLSGKHLTKYVSDVCRTAQELSTALGWPGSDGHLPERHEPAKVGAEASRDGGAVG